MLTYSLLQNCVAHQLADGASVDFPLLARAVARRGGGAWRLGLRHNPRGGFAARSFTGGSAPRPPLWLRLDPAGGYRPQSPFRTGFGAEPQRGLLIQALKTVTVPVSELFRYRGGIH